VQNISCILLYDQTDAAQRRAAAAGKYHAPPPTKVDQRATAAAEPKHPVRRRRPNIIGVGVYFCQLICFESRK